MNNRAQAVMFDFLVACFIFFVLFAVIAGSWQKNYETIVVEEKQKTLQKKAERAIDFLLLNPGNPNNWQNLSSLTGVSEIGLALKQNVLDSRKVQKLAEYALVPSDYERVKELLGLQGFDFFIQIDSVQDKNISFKRSDLNNSITIERFATYNGNDARIYFTLYEVNT